MGRIDDRDRGSTVMGAKAFIAWLTLCAGVVATVSALTVLVMHRPVEAPYPNRVTLEELEKTKLILGFAERNCKKLGFRVEGSGAYVSVSCGAR
jgi:hypothetical protein